MVGGKRLNTCKTVPFDEVYGPPMIKSRLLVRDYNEC